MYPTIQQILEQLHFDPTEIKVYIATLKKGLCSASKIADSIGLNRITTYEALKRLSRRGLVRTRTSGRSRVKKYEVAPIHILEDKLITERMLLERNIESLSNIKSELAAQFASQQDRPEVIYYDGKEGIKAALNDTLVQKSQEIVSFVSADSLEDTYGRAFLDSYWHRRTTLKIPSRGIMPKTTRAVKLFKPEKNAKELRTIKFIPMELKSYCNEIDIYGDNVAIIALRKDQEHAFIIRSSTIAESLRNLYEVFWRMLD